MKISMTRWLRELPTCGKPMPLLSFPAAQLVGASVYRFTHDAELQAQGIAEVAHRTPAAAAVCMMDLSVEAEAFGCTIKAEENEVPTVIGALVSDDEGARALSVPYVGDARTALYVEAARLAKQRVTDRPVLAGIIGPFSLAGRLMDVTEALANCIDDPDLVHMLLEKSTEFLSRYAAAFKAAGADGIVMAEPLSGLLSPSLEREFSAPYVRRIIDAVQDEDFAVIYHNCGPNTPHMTASLAENGAAAYHFGDAVDLEQLLKAMPADKPVCGNISPVEQFLHGTPDSMRAAVSELRARCASYPNFVLSSGCDIPHNARWENIDAFFE